MLTGDLDEFSVAALAAEPVDGYGVGTSLVTGSGAPTAALVYKLVARADSEGPGPLRPMAKRSVGKPSRGGRKWATVELVTDSEPRAGNGGRPQLQPLVRGGEIIGRESLATARARHRDAVLELPDHARQLSRGYPAIPTAFQPDRD